MATVKTPAAPKVTIPIVDQHVSALWALVAMEIGALVFLRHYFRRHHGG